MIKYCGRSCTCIQLFVLCIWFICSIHNTSICLEQV